MCLSCLYLSVKSGTQTFVLHRADSCREGFLEEEVCSGACERGEVGGTSLEWEWCSKSKGFGDSRTSVCLGQCSRGGCEVGGHGLNTGSMETQGERLPSLSFLTEAGAGSTVHASVSQRPVPFLAGPRSFGAVPHPSCACRRVNPGACSPRRCLPHAPGAPGSSRASTIRGSGYPPRTGSGAQWHQERGAGWGSLVSPLAQAEPIGQAFWSLIPFSFTNL